MLSRPGPPGGHGINTAWFARPVWFVSIDAALLDVADAVISTHSCLHCPKRHPQGGYNPRAKVARTRSACMIDVPFRSPPQTDCRLVSRQAGSELNLDAKMVSVRWGDL